MEDSLHFLQSYMYTYQVLAIPFTYEVLVFTEQKRNICPHTDLYVNIPSSFITITQTGKHPSVLPLVQEVVLPDKGILLSNEELDSIHATTQVNLKSMVLSEETQKEKAR